jgi:hypothetical protein
MLKIQVVLNELASNFPKNLLFRDDSASVCARIQR